MSPNKLRKQEPTPADLKRFIKSEQHKFRAHIVLEFEGPVSIAKGREAARRLLDRLSASAPLEEGADAPCRARIVCPDLQRVVKVEIGPEG